MIFGGLIAPGQLHEEIFVEPGITTSLIGVRVDVDVVSIDFVSSISGGEKTVLDGVVACGTCTRFKH